jgi:hypothetical protein
VALLGFVLLGAAILSFDEPDRGRFDINHSVMNNPDDSIKAGSNAFAYEISQTKNLKIQMKEIEGERFKFITDYFKALRELFVNEAAIWILLAACLRTQ